jgi:hypothetical protein
MKSILLLIAAAITLSTSFVSVSKKENRVYARCTGSSYCGACSNCSSCKWCNSGEVVGFALQHLRGKQQNKEALNAGLPQKKEVNVVEKPRQEVNIAGNTISNSFLL